MERQGFYFIPFGKPQFHYQAFLHRVGHVYRIGTLIQFEGVVLKITEKGERKIHKIIGSQNSRRQLYIQFCFYFFTSVLQPFVNQPFDACPFSQTACPMLAFRRD